VTGDKGKNSSYSKKLAAFRTEEERAAFCGIHRLHSSKGIEQ